MKAWIIKFKKLYRLLPPLLARDIKERYAGSSLGMLWTFLQPLLFMAVFWLVFARIMKIKVAVEMKEIHYLPFLLSGILPWFALQEGVVRGASSIVEKGYIIKKVFYPSELFPVSAVISSFIHYGIAMCIFFVIFFVHMGGIAFSHIPVIFYLILLQLMLTAGIALSLSALAVYIRDILQVLGVVFQVLFYLTTVIYPITSVPDGLKVFIKMNPFTLLIEGYHAVVLYGRVPNMYDIALLTIISVIALLSGIFVFRKLKGGFADVL